MLVLSRKKNQVIRIGEDITLVVVEIRGNKVRIGLDAPKDVSIYRQEIYEAIKRKETDPCSSTGTESS